MSVNKIKVALLNPADQVRSTVDNLSSGISSDDFVVDVILSKRAFDETKTIPGVSYHIFKCYYIPGIRYPLPGLSFLIQLFNVRNSDIFHINSYIYLTSAVSIIVGKILRKDVIVTVDAVPGRNWEYGSPVVDRIANLYSITVGRFVLDLADSIVGLGEYTRNELQTLTTLSKLQIIPNGVDTNLFSPEPEASQSLNSRNKVQLLYVGRLDPVKNLELLFDSLSIILEKHGNIAELIVVGDGTKMEDYIDYCHTININDSVSFEGWSNNVVKYYNSSDILVMTSLSEGQPTVILEAHSCGIPVVSTNVGAVNEMVKYGRIVNHDSADYFANAILDLVRNGKFGYVPEIRERVIKNYSKESMVSSYSKLYKQIASN